MMHKQRGISLIIALIMLVGMMLAGIGLFRKISGGAILAGNLTFTSSAIVASNQGSEAARTWLMSQTATTLYNPVAASGYYPAKCYLSNAVVPANCDGTPAPADFVPATFDWAGSAFVVTTSDAAGNDIRYVIHRLCSLAGSMETANQSCTFTSTTTSTSHDDETHLSVTVTPYYRVTTRVLGPRGATVYTQLMMF